MPFIGNQPTAVPLTSADLEDNIITTAKIADANVTNPKLSSGSQQNFRNIIINGDMSIAQRGTSASGLTNGSGGYYTCDRWRYNESGTTNSVFTQSQDTDVPTGQGFATSLKMDCTTAEASLSSNTNVYLTQIFEGQNLQYIKKGTANAESLTCSFWVKSNKTGTYIVGLQEFQNTRYIANSYTINSANTWEKKTITFAGDTTGTLTNDNSASLYLQFYLLAGTDFTSGTLATNWESTTNANRAVGQVNLADSTANYINITGVQLEAGTTASDFEFLPHDVNLRRCQRYYAVIVDGSVSNPQMFSIGCMFTSSEGNGHITCPVKMRSTPTFEVVSGTNYYKLNRNSAIDGVDSISINAGSNGQSVGFLNNTNMSGTAGHAGAWFLDNASGKIALSSEL